MILAAGLGRRMQPLSRDSHKGLMAVNGTPILEQAVDKLLACGVDNIIVVTGHQAEPVKSLLQERFPGQDFTYVDNPRFESTNNIVSLALALDALPPRTNMLLIECDLVFTTPVLKLALSAPDRNLALLDHYAMGMDGTVVSLSQGRVSQVYPPQTQDEDFDFSDKYKTLNIYHFTADFIERTFARLVRFYAEGINQNCYYELVLGLIIHMQHEEIVGLCVDAGSWAEIDDPNDLQAAEFLFSKERRGEILDQNFGGYWNYPVRDFAYMHNPYFPSGAMLGMLKAHTLDVISRYSSSQQVLNQKLAWFEQCEASTIIALNGLSQVYPILHRQFEGKRVLIPTPSFGEYSRIFPGAETYDDSNADPDQVLATVARRASDVDIVVLVNPNNPTGTLLASEKLLAMIEAAPAALWIVDESFIDFTTEPSLLSALEQRNVDNVLLLKSLSKLFGTPGLRIGYAYTQNAALYAAIFGELPIWNMNALAEYFLELVLKFRPGLEDSLRRCRAASEHFRKQLSSLPIIESVASSCSNFLLLTLNLEQEEALELEQRLLREQDTYIKRVTERFPDERPRWRLAVRTWEENEQFLENLSLVLET